MLGPGEQIGVLKISVSLLLLTSYESPVKPAARTTHGLISTVFVSIDGMYERHGSISPSSLLESIEARMYALCGCRLLSALSCCLPQLSCAEWAEPNLAITWGFWAICRD